MIWLDFSDVFLRILEIAQFRITCFQLEGGFAVGWRREPNIVTVVGLWRRDIHRIGRHGSELTCELRTVWIVGVDRIFAMT